MDPEQRGTAFYDQGGVHCRYTAHRERERHLSPNHVMEEPAFLAEVGDPSGLRVLDLGCGDGGFGRQLLQAGARSYLGVDNSRRMVDAATASLAGTPGRAVLGSMEDLDLEPGSVDLVTARLSLHYVADLDRLLRTVAQGLGGRGRLVASVVHPIITSHDSTSVGPRTTWTVDDYFEAGPRQRRWMGSEVTWYHRTVEQYVKALTGAGLALVSLRECEPDPERFDGHLDELARRRRVPLFLLLHARA